MSNKERENPENFAYVRAVLNQNTTNKLCKSKNVDACQN